MDDRRRLETFIAFLNSPERARQLLEVFAQVLRSGATEIDSVVVAASSAFNGWRLTDPGSRSIYSLTTARKRKIGGFPTVLKASRLRL